MTLEHRKIDIIQQIASSTQEEFIDAIDEVIIFGSSNDKGLALIRVLGDDMNPANLVQLMQAIQKSDYDGEGLGEIGKFLKG